MGYDDQDRRPRKKTFGSGIPEFKVPTDSPEAMMTIVIGLVIVGLLAGVILIARACTG